MTFGQWLSTLDWGTIPDWLVGIGTLGTLIFTVSIIARDRRDKRQAVVNKVICWMQFHRHDYDDGTYKVVRRVTVHNGSDLPMAQVKVFYKSQSGEYEATDVERLNLPLPAKETRNFEFRDDYWSIRKNYVIVAINEGNARRWHRSVYTGKYIPTWWRVRLFKRTWDVRLGDFIADKTRAW